MDWDCFLVEEEEDKLRDECGVAGVFLNTKKDTEKKNAKNKKADCLRCEQPAF